MRHGAGDLSPALAWARATTIVATAAAKPVNAALILLAAFSPSSPLMPVWIEPFMRALLMALCIATVLGGITAAQAEKRIFIIANNADGYGVDRCLASGAGCGTAVATAYCQSRDFSKAASFRKIDRDEITGAVAAGGGCSGASCQEFVAIECTR